MPPIITLYVYILLQIADGILTYIGLKSAIAEEVNPLLAPFADSPGLAIVIIKMIGIGALTTLFFLATASRAALTGWVFVMVDIWYLYVIWNNWQVIYG